MNERSVKPSKLRPGKPLSFLVAAVPSTLGTAATNCAYGPAKETANEKKSGMWNEVRLRVSAKHDRTLHRAGIARNQEKKPFRFKETKAFPRFSVNDLEAAKAFYADTLGLDDVVERSRNQRPHVMSSGVET